MTILKDLVPSFNQNRKQMIRRKSTRSTKLGLADSLEQKSSSKIFRSRWSSNLTFRAECKTNQFFMSNQLEIFKTYQMYNIDSFNFLCVYSWTPGRGGGGGGANSWMTAVCRAPRFSPSKPFLNPRMNLAWLFVLEWLLIYSSNGTNSSFLSSFNIVKVFNLI